ncbi:hypothetical protein EJB05_32236 [Eragrostis curvula]|uniref:SHSP domain-containing protein n=1 Tax=Eragrostis curvula TaxID=38414 RepID=A0A5J9UGN6_9POAL|nr:hypothetical protein EJB05_32175 [Eragrostis curvula]TVU22529.1 hypothetical protein EJB05_32236 [Eragrostis curvula]
MSTVTAHTLLSQPVRHSAGGSALRLPKPAVVSFPSYAPAGKKTPRSICHYADPRSIDHPSNIPPAALVHPVLPPTPTTTALWKIKEDDKKVELTFFSMPEEAKPSDFQIAVEGDVLEIRRPPADQQQWKPDDVSFHVRLHLPELYDKEKITAELERRNLVVIIPKVPNLQDGGPGKPFYKKVNVIEPK